MLLGAHTISVHWDRPDYLILSTGFAKTMRSTYRPPKTVDVSVHASVDLDLKFDDSGSKLSF